MASASGWFGGAPAPRTILIGTMCLSLGVALQLWMMLPRRKAGLATSSLSPKSALAGVSASEVESLPYPPDVLPGGRDVPTSYGSIRVFEWGPENGQQVLLVHGISTPAIALGDLAHELVGRGYRVMLFDLFGRGYSDAPNDLPYDVRLYVTQILLVVASSRISWTHFHLVGYSLGGCLSVSFARYFPHRLASLNLIAGGGLIRPYHVGWKSKLLYNSGLLPEWLVRYLVKRRNRPVEKLPIAASPTDIVAAESKMQPGNGDASGGTGFDAASISKYRPGVTVSSVVAWQLDHHLGFVNAFLSTIRTAHIYSPQADWRVLGSILAARRRSSADGTILAPGLEKGKVLLVLGSDDPVIVSDETIPDAKEVLGEDAVECVVLTGGHEIPITMSTEVASVLDAFWTADKELEVQG